MRTNLAISCLGLGGALLVASCHMAPPRAASQYQPAVPLPPLGVSFAPGIARPPPAQVAQLRALALQLPEQVVPVLYAGGGMAPLRAAAIGRDMQRPVGLVLQPDSPPDQAVLVFPTSPGVVADDCRGPGARVAADIWPGDDHGGPHILPPGCATAGDIAVQVTNQEDLLYGRPLPPGAALPYAKAVEQYYSRNDGGRAAGQSGSGSGAGEAGFRGGGSGSGGSGGGNAASQDQPAAANSGWGYGQGQPNPLLGPLQPGQAQH